MLALDSSFKFKLYLVSGRKGAKIEKLGGQNFQRGFRFDDF